MRCFGFIRNARRFRVWYSAGIDKSGRRGSRRDELLKIIQDGHGLTRGEILERYERQVSGLLQPQASAFEP